MAQHFSSWTHGAGGGDKGGRVISLGLCCFAIGSVHKLQAIVLSLHPTKQEHLYWDGKMSISASEFSL